jgi:hypothetical protein
MIKPDGRMGRPGIMDALPKWRRDDLLRQLVLKQKSAVQVAKEIGCTDTSVHRFMKKVTQAEITKIIAEDAQKRKLDDATGIATILNEDGADVASDLGWVLRELKDLLQSAKGDEDRVMQLGSLKEIRQALMSIAEVRGQLSKKIDVHLNLNESPQFITLRQIILKVLDNHPAAKQDFLAEMKVLQVISQ